MTGSVVTLQEEAASAYLRGQRYISWASSVHALRPTGKSACGPGGKASADFWPMVPAGKFCPRCVVRR